MNSQANRRYLAFAKQAEKDGHPMIARLFRAVAAAETVHAHSHLRVMNGVGTTEENLKAAMAGENYEVTSMYPEFIADAEKRRQEGRHVLQMGLGSGKSPRAALQAGAGPAGFGGRRAGNLGLPGMREYLHRQTAGKMPGLQYPRVAIRKDRLIEK